MLHALKAVPIETQSPHLNDVPAYVSRCGSGGTGNSIVRRLRDPNFITRYFVGHGIDIGCEEHNTLGNYAEFFPGMKSTMMWNIDDGDAQYMKPIEDNTFDWVHSSHCLEHLKGPCIAIRHWWRILKPGGHMVVIVPDEDMYEQGVWPSQFNGDHKWSFTTYKRRSWAPMSVNVFELLMHLRHADIIKVERLTSTFRSQGIRTDQSMSSIGEPAIEFIARKLS
jgi:predicted SAM-dependent methyltransferase